MTPSQRDAVVIMITITLASLLAGLWFTVLSPLLALLVTSVTSFALGTVNVLLGDRWHERDEDEHDDAS